MKLYYPLALLSIAFMSGCGMSDNNQPSDTELMKKLVEVQEQLNLITKEVVQLNEKISASSNSNANAKEKGLSIEIDAKLGRTARFGSENAKVAVVEFMDYQCPYCVRHAQNVFPKLMKKYVDNGLVQYAVRDFPLDFHTQGKNSAHAAKCALDQGHFLAMHKKLVDNSRKLNSDIYMSLAQEIELDTERFSSCMQDSSIAEYINQDIAYGVRVGVSGTPRFFVGRVDGDMLVDVTPISGAASLTTFDNIITRLLN